jgi:hypothetical protein
MVRGVGNAPTWSRLSTMCLPSQPTALTDLIIYEYMAVSIIYSSMVPPDRLARSSPGYEAGPSLSRDWRLIVKMPNIAEQQYLLVYLHHAIL